MSTSLAHTLAQIESRQPDIAFGVINYVEHFLSPHEADALCRTCASLEFLVRQNPRNPTSQIRHQTVSFTDHPSARASYVGGHYALTDAPSEIRAIARQLTAYVGRPVNYLSVVRYRDGADHMNWHQHREDKGHNTPVLIVSTGAERHFSIREKDKPATARHFIAGHGSLIVMSSDANDTHEHAVLNTKGVCAARYAINAKCVDSQY